MEKPLNPKAQRTAFPSRRPAHPYYRSSDVTSLVARYPTVSSLSQVPSHRETARNLSDSASEIQQEKKQVDLAVERKTLQTALIGID